MDKKPLATPVAFLIFNRPDETRRVFEKIREARPPMLFVVADGPRNDQERAKCLEARRVVDEHVDWPCEVKRNYADKNMGVKYRPSSGLNWVFEQTERAIILEDDCVPDPTFFIFCQEMLERYANDPRIMHITGSNNQDMKKLKVSGDYFFTRIPNICGWATWRRAWKLYDLDMRSWPAYKASGELAKRIDNPGAYERFSLVWDKYYAHEVNAWDGPWTYALISHDGLAINPAVNLISNVGNKSGVHAEANPEKIYRFGDKPTMAMHFPLRHPKEIIVNRMADSYVYRHEFGIDHKLSQRLTRPIKTYLPGFFGAYRKAKKLVKKST